MTPGERARLTAIELADINFEGLQLIASDLRKVGHEVELNRGEPTARFVSVITEAIEAAIIETRLTCAVIVEQWRELGLKTWTMTSDGAEDVPDIDEIAAAIRPQREGESSRA